jgi:hypothetical protein
MWIIPKMTKDSTRTYKTWAVMHQALEEEFKDVNSGKNARDSMARLCQGGKDRAMIIYGWLKQKRTGGSGLYIPPARRHYVATSGTRANPIIVNREQLSPEKQAELRKKGACFRCKKVGHLARDCPSRRPN